MFLFAVRSNHGFGAGAPAGGPFSRGLCNKKGLGASHAPSPATPEFNWIAVPPQDSAPRGGQASLAQNRRMKPALRRKPIGDAKIAVKRFDYGNLVFF